MPRILWLCEFPLLNGAERSLLATLPGLRRRGFEVQALAPPHGPLAEALAEAQVPLHPWEVRQAGQRRPAEELRAELHNAVQALRPDLLHANSLSMGRLSGPVVQGLPLPSIAHVRDIVRLSRAATEDLNRHRRILAVSRATADFHIASGLEPDKTDVMYNGVDLGCFAPAPPTGSLHRELKLPRDTPLVGTIGQIGLRKGQDLLLAALALLSPQRPLPHVVIVGQRCSGKGEAQEFEAALLRQAASEPLAGRVHLLGPREDVPELLREFTLLVHPARQEPLGRVLLEAAASGTPVIATQVGGTAEIFPPDTNTALLVPPNDPRTLQQALEHLLEDAPARLALGAAARRRAVQHFDARRAADELADHYQALLATGR